MISLAIVAALKAVGIILAIAVLVAPGAIAYLIAHNFAQMMAISVLVAVGSTITGIYASFFLDSASAPTIVLTMTAVFIVTFVSVQVRARTR